MEYSSQQSNMTPNFYSSTAQVGVHSGLAIKNEADQQVPSGQDTTWAAAGFETYYGQMGTVDAMGAPPCSDALMDAMDELMGVDSLQELPGME